MALALFLFSCTFSPALATSGEIEIEAEGNVNYDINSNITTATKNVRVTSEEMVLTAEELIYDGNTGIVEASGGIKLTSIKDQVIIEAERLTYDNNLNSAKAFGKVRLNSKNEVWVEAEQLVYDGRTGQIIASGGVKIITKQGRYQTETINYNLHESTGNLGSVAGTIAAKGRDYLITGKNMETDKGISKLKNATITRCEKPNPDYLLVAKKAKYDGKQMELTHVFLFVKGIPVFYFPIVSFATNNTNLPDIEPGYSESDGFTVKFGYSTPVKENKSWRFKGELKTKGDSVIETGINAYYGSLSNYAGIFYDFDGFWGIEDQLVYDKPLVIATADGYREYSNSLDTEIGFKITRKYWDGLGGKWQFGILGRKVSAYDESDTEYGGTYGGYRLDYKPHPIVTLSLFRIESFAGGDYRDFMDDFKTGSNWLYNIGAPIKNTLYSWGIDGTYNSDHSRWIHRIYRLYRETCCFKVTFGWDDVPKSWFFGGTIKF